MIARSARPSRGTPTTREEKKKKIKKHDQTMKYIANMMNTPRRRPYQNQRPANKADAGQQRTSKSQFHRRNKLRRGFPGGSPQKRLTGNLNARASGELAAAEGLAGPDQAKRVRAGTDGRPITDWHLPRVEGVPRGYWIVDVGNPERAYQIAAEASAAPGVGGKPLNLAIEVRQVMSAPSSDLG
jgi:hypothetical protein